MADHIYNVVAIALVASVVIGYPIWCLRHARWLLKRWGLKNGYYVTRAYLLPYGSVLFLVNSTLWRAEFTDVDGNKRMGKARCGTENVDVTFDDER
jgi:hypothetical protein